MVFQTLKWVGGADGYLEIIDQRELPGAFLKLRCVSVEEVFEAIKTLAVRGAPAMCRRRYRFWMRRVDILAGLVRRR